MQLELQIPDAAMACTDC